MSTSLRATRQNQKLTQLALANAAGIRVQDLRRWERGLGSAPEHVVEKLAVALGLTSDVVRLMFDDANGAAEIGEGYVTCRAEGELLLARRERPAPTRKKVLDLFCGTGGFSYGFEQTQQFCVTAGIDLLQDRVKSFHKNHPSATAIASDIRKFSVQDLAGHADDPDVIIGGPPCQGFSSIRPFRTPSEGDPRNALPNYFLLVLRDIKPKWFVFENVVGLLSHDGGKSFFQLLNAFGAIGFRTDWRVINAASFGLPQYRERVIVVGNSRNRKFDWPLPTHDITYKSMAGKHAQHLLPEPLFAGTLDKPVTTMDAIGDLPPIRAGESAHSYNDSVELTGYQAAMRNGETRLTLHQATAHSTKMLEIIRKAGKNRYQLPDGMTTSGFSSCYSRLAPDEPSTTITVNFVHPSSNRCIHPYQDRALTPREGARIQGFPDSFEFAGSRPQIVKQIGNAVPPILGYVLAKAIVEQF